MAFGKAVIIKDCKDFRDEERKEENDNNIALSNHILSPSEMAVAFSDKPNILHESKNTLRDFYKIPEYLRLDPESTSWVEVQAFAERVGYPIVVKGATQGCVLCHNWFALSGCLRHSFRYNPVD